MEGNKNIITSLSIGLLGDSTVGKTAIVQSIMNIEFSKDMLVTIGSEKLERRFKLKNNKEIKLVFWDNSGNERFRAIGLKSMKFAQGIMLIFDLTQKRSFDDLNIWLDLIKDNLNYPLIILIGNKADEDKYRWEVTSEEASKFAEKYHFAYFETSAKTRQGINEGLSYLVNAIYDKIMGIDEKDKVMDINDIKKSNKNSNCAGNKNGKNNKK